MTRSKPWESNRVGCWYSGGWCADTLCDLNATKMNVLCCQIGNLCFTSSARDDYSAIRKFRPKHVYIFRENHVYIRIFFNYSSTSQFRVSEYWLTFTCNLIGSFWAGFHVSVFSENILNSLTSTYIMAEFMHIYIYMCVCVCVCAFRLLIYIRIFLQKEKECLCISECLKTYLHTHTHTHIYIYI